MFRFVVFAACAAALASAAVVKSVVHEPEAQGIHLSEVTEGSDGSEAYAAVAELKDLAHTSALQAKSEIQNQNTTENQAAFGAKSILAQAAFGAAAIAQAALVGNQVIVQGLELQLQDAKKQLQAEIEQFYKSEHAAKVAQNTVEQSEQQVSVLMAALTASQGGATHAAKVAAEAAGAEAAQRYIIQNAKSRVAHVTEQLHKALAELQNSRSSAQKAAVAAHVAQSDAADAANAVANSAVNSAVQSVRAEHEYEDSESELVH